MVKKKKPQTPAKIKYDKSHPVVSIRVDPELKKKLEEIRHTFGHSPAYLLRKAAGLHNKANKGPYVQGRSEGEKKAKDKYCIRYKCSICGGDKILETEPEKKAASEYMRDNGWGHAHCIKKPS